MSYEVAKSVTGRFAELRDNVRIFDTQSEAEKRCLVLNRERAATVRSVAATELMDLGFGWDETERHLGGDE